MVALENSVRQVKQVCLWRDFSEPLTYECACGLQEARVVCAGSHADVTLQSLLGESSPRRWLSLLILGALPLSVGFHLGA